MKISLTEAYKRLFSAFGPQRWWPARSRFEVITGAILTQNTAWSNVEKAIANLMREGALASPRAMAAIGRRELAALIRPAGYYNIKAARLGNFLTFLKDGFGYSIDALARLETGDLHGRLLGVNGIGPETCDSILLYDFRRTVFVVDAYTKRVFSRHGLFGEDPGYDLVQEVFTRNLRRERRLFNEYHALIVRLAKERCRKRPLCAGCPLEGAKFACK